MKIYCGLTGISKAFQKLIAWASAPCSLLLFCNKINQILDSFSFNKLTLCHTYISWQLNISPCNMLLWMLTIATEEEFAYDPSGDEDKSPASSGS
jgi:hypothetical protein